MCRACLVTPWLPEMMMQYFIWFGLMSLNLRMAARKPDVFVMGPQDLGRFKSLTKPMQTALIKPVRGSSMRSPWQKTYSCLVLMSPMLLPKHLPQNKVSIFVRTKPSTSGGLNIRNEPQSHLVTLFRSSLPCSVTPNPLNFRNNMPMPSCKNLV